MKAQPTDTMTVLLRPETRSKLEELARVRRLSGSNLAADAIAEFVDKEMAIVEGIRQGVADVSAGRVTPHDDAMRQIRSCLRGPG